MNLYFHDEFYELLMERAGKGHISQFIEESLMPIISGKGKDLEAGYRKMGQDRQQMQEAIKMANASLPELNNEPW